MRKTQLIAITAIGLLVVACGGGASPSASSAAPSSAAPSSAAPSSEAPESSAPASESPDGSAATGEAVVAAGESPLGIILVDSEGRTLYMFKPDSAGRPTCYDACAENWPPLLTEDEPTAGNGIAAAIATVDRTDGGKQVKIGSWPLYYFAGDTEPGQTNGQGQGGNWFVVGRDGNPIEG